MVLPISFCLELGQHYFEEKRLLKAVARDAGIGYRTAQRWMMRYRKYGLAGLARNGRVDRGQRRTITPELKEILEALARRRSGEARKVKEWCCVGEHLVRLNETTSSASTASTRDRSLAEFAKLPAGSTSRDMVLLQRRLFGLSV